MRRRKRVVAQFINLVDVARAAGVSKSTASYALRSHPLVAAATRDRVLKAAHRLGYHPDPAFAAMMEQVRQRRSPRSLARLAVVDCAGAERLDALSRAIVGHVMVGIRQEAEALNYSVDVLPAHSAKAGSGHLGRVLRARGVRGLIIYPGQASAALLDWTQFSIVKIGFCSSAVAFHEVNINHLDGAETCASRLHDLGYRRLGFVTARERYTLSRGVSVAGYENWRLHLRASDSAPALICDEREVVAATEAYVREHRLDALVLADNSLVDHLHDRRSARLSCIGYATLDIPPAQDWVAGIVQDHLALGAIAVRQLHVHLLHSDRGVPALPTTLLLPAKWKDGASAPPVSSRRKRPAG